MKKQLLRDGLGWGLVLWAFGYALGIMLFPFVPPHLIGWIIAPFGTAMAVWIAFTRVKGDTLRYYCLIGFLWLLLAVIADYVFIVKAFKPADGYYKPDVYLYYALTFTLPVIAGWRQRRRGSVVVGSRSTLTL